MGYGTQSQSLRFLFNPSQDVGGNNMVKLYRWGNVCTVDLQLKEDARLVKLSAFAFIPTYDPVVGQQTVQNLSINNWTAEGRWRSATREYIRISQCDFNCPVNFAALSIVNFENWFLTNYNNTYTRECFFMGGYSIERLNINWNDLVDLTPVPFGASPARRLFIDFRFTVEYEF